MKSQVQVAARLIAWVSLVAERKAVCARGERREVDVAKELLGIDVEQQVAGRREHDRNGNGRNDALLADRSRPGLGRIGARHAILAYGDGSGKRPRVAILLGSTLHLENGIGVVRVIDTDMSEPDLSRE